MSVQTIGRYEIEQEVGRGGMAAVYLARDPYMQRRVAIKTMSRALSEDPDFQQRFLTEARTIAQLEHAYIVPVYDFGEHETQMFLVMRYMPNNSLDYWLKQGTLGVSDCVVVLERIAEALDEAHSRGVVHRDLKPANIMFDRQGGAYLGDFGLVKLIGQAGGSTGGSIAGTAAYMAPEQISGDKDVDHRADIYAMGATLFEMLIGYHPYRNENQTKVMMMHVLEPVPDIRQHNADLPEGIEGVIQRAMAKAPADRYQSAMEMIDALAGIGRTILTRRARKRWMADELSAKLGELMNDDTSGEGQSS